MIAVSFIHPWIAAAGLVAAALPIVIHLINRRRYRVEKWAAMGFLLAANQRSARRITLQHWLLLLLRCGVVGLAAAAVARPFLRSARFAPLAETRVHHVLVIDNSASMQAVDGGDSPSTSRFERAIATGESLLAGFPAGDPVSIVTLAAPAKGIVGYANFDRRQVRDRLRQISVTEAATDLAGGLKIAAGLLEASPAAPGNRAVYVLTDLQASAWEGEAPAEPPAETAAQPQARQEPRPPARQVPATAELRPRPPATPVSGALSATATRVARDAKLWFIRIGKDAAENLAITDVSYNASLAGGDLPLRLSAEVANFGRTVVRGATLDVIRDDIIDRTLTIDALGPGERRVLQFALAIEMPGSHAVQVRLGRGYHDALALDDARSLAVDVVQSVPVLLVDGRHAWGAGAPLGGKANLSGQAGYLATALAPSPRPGEKTLLAPRVISDTELEGEPLAANAIIVLCNVGQLEPVVWSRLASFVAHGGGLAIFAGDLVNRDHYNRWAGRQGAGLLPGELGEPVSDADSRAGHVFHFSPESLNHPMLAPFSSATDTGFFRTRVTRYLPIKPDAARAAVALRYDNGDPAIVTGTLGDGRLAYISSTANMEWTNLPAKGDYVAFALNLAAWLAPQHGARHNLLVGETLRAPLSPAQASLPLRVTGPSGTGEARLVRVAQRPGAAEAGFEMQYDAAAKCGVYVASIGNTRVAAATFAANLDPRESDLAALDEQGLKRRIDGPFTLLSESEMTADGARGGLRDAPSELATLATGGVLALLLIEMWLAARFGALR